MGYYDAYNAILSVQSSSPRNSRVDITKRSIKTDFFNNPSYYQVPTYTPSTPLSSTPLDVWVLDDSETKNQKEIVLYPDQPLDMGYLFYWDNQYWLTLMDDNMVDIYRRAAVLRCYSYIKWLDNSGDIRQTWFCIQSDSVSNFGVEDGRIIIMPNERRTITIQKNVYTSQINKEKRFIIDGRAWRTIGVDRIKDGLITLTLEEHQIDPARDNLELGIADYTTFNFSVVITNGNSQVSLDQTLQLNVEGYVNGVLNSNADIKLSVSDESIGMIDTSNIFHPLAVGNVTITATYQNATTSISVDVVNVDNNNYAVEIVGDDSIYVNKSASYSANFTLNGYVISETPTFILYADDGVSSTILATLNQTGDTCTVVAGSKTGYVQLYVQNSDGTIHTMKRIRIKSLI